MVDTIIPEGYVPTDKEEFMNPIMKAYFKRKLENWHKELVEEYNDAMSKIKQGAAHEADPADRATYEQDMAFEMRTRDRERKLIRKIEEAIRRIEKDNYGYCEDTGEPIAVARLDARPVATLSFEAQEQREKEEKQYREA